jgi:uncharacterized protein YhaN
MRLRTLWLDGYGRFANRVIDLAPGLQVIVGPNEQGKTTVRRFITEMLYGQKRSLHQRIYEDAQELRRPWSDAPRYGGRILYVLDDGREIEVQRDFDRDSESVQVFDRTNGREVTGEFEMLRNRELNFAETHLGLSKAVFISTATISHMSLEHLGDEDALVQIREKILALADSAEEARSSEAAIQWLDERIAEIGRPTARVRPLPAARARRIDVERELREVAEHRRETAAIEERRAVLRDEIDALTEQQIGLNEELQTVERISRAKRLTDAEVLLERVDAATKRCFSLSSARTFPLEQLPDVQRAEYERSSALKQIRQTRAELEKAEAQLNAERQHLGPFSRKLEEIPEEYEQRLSDFETKIDRLSERLEALDGNRKEARERLMTAQNELNNLPDFARAADDPVMWLQQLANTFSLAQRARTDERDKLDDLCNRLRECRAELEEPRRVFSQWDDFSHAALNHELATQQTAVRLSSLRGRSEALQAAAARYADDVPSAALMAVLSLLSVIGSIAAAIHTGVQGVYIVSALAILFLAYFVYNFMSAYLGARRARAEQAEAEREIETLEQEHEERHSEMAHRIQDAGCKTLRELEALFDRYQQGLSRLASLEKQVSNQEERVRDQEARLSQMFGQLRETFLQLGENLANEAMVQEAAGRAVARYHEYRDAKRRVSEGRDQVHFYDSHHARTRSELEALLQEERGLALEARRLMREYGYPEEAKIDSARKALRAYRIRYAQVKAKHGKVDALQERVDELARRLGHERDELDQIEKGLEKLLENAGVKSVEEWHAWAAKAREYRETRDELTVLEEKLDAVLAGENIDDLRKQVEADGAAPTGPAGNAGDLQRELSQVNELLETRRKEQHQLDVQIAQRGAGLRSLSEIEEELAAVDCQIKSLEIELEAASYAAAVVEEVARDKHARIAPRLAALAGRFLGAITDGAYEELFINRDLGLSVRIPETTRINDDPERRLSKGTVDQIYFALRLAMVQVLSEDGEHIPMLLDDPFANYDDARLERAMSLLARLGDESQVLLFTCREDVARVAASLEAPILEL